ncbi:hypothetical protein CYMTET_47882 [Cymbomonas tetramitiformis]|uniref:Uncharacterized protein n=1 Tax=Cymbomonas tetramitiformis TaxID=36881 RepID=A0AAE0EW67_9CHLO|nr:hypothetical protein CYMTET_47882 [Cymbomonas tetramitiformis]
MLQQGKAMEKMNGIETGMTANDGLRGNRVPAEQRAPEAEEGEGEMLHAPLCGAGDTGNEAPRVGKDAVTKEALAQPQDLKPRWYTAETEEEEREEQYPKNLVSQGIFRDDGKLNMYQVDLAMEELDARTPGARTMQDMLHVLEETDPDVPENDTKKTGKPKGHANAHNRKWALTTADDTGL